MDGLKCPIQVSKKSKACLALHANDQFAVGSSTDLSVGVNPKLGRPSPADHGDRHAIESDRPPAYSSPHDQSRSRGRGRRVHALAVQFRQHMQCMQPIDSIACRPTVMYYINRRQPVYKLKWIFLANLLFPASFQRKGESRSRGRRCCRSNAS